MHVETDIDKPKKNKVLQRCCPASVIVVEDDGASSDGPDNGTAGALIRPTCSCPSYGPSSHHYSLGLGLLFGSLITAPAIPSLCM